jgi:hypothetical protein
VLDELGERLERLVGAITMTSDDDTMPCSGVNDVTGS